MTREEAIKWLSDELVFLTRPNVNKGSGLEKKIAVCRMAIDALREQEERRWIPVTERLPEINMPVLVYCTNITIQGGYTIHIGCCDMGKFWFLRTQPGISSFPVREWQVTHWMPLPESPKEDAQ